MKILIRFSFVISSLFLSSVSFAQSPQTFIWEAGSDFEAGYFDVKYENEKFVALPSIWAGSLDTKFLDSSSSIYDCERDTPKALNALVTRPEKVTGEGGEDTVLSRAKATLSTSRLDREEIKLGAVKDVSIDGSKGWRFPKRDEILNSQEISGWQKGFCYDGGGLRLTIATPYIAYHGQNEGRFGTNRGVALLYHINTDQRATKYYYAGGLDKSDRNRWITTSTTSSYHNRNDRSWGLDVVLVRDGKEFENNAFISSFEPVTRIQSYAEGYKAYKLTPIRREISPPTIMPLPAQELLVKDEFETTAMYQNRVAETERKWAADVASVNQKNEAQQREYENALSQADREFQQNLVNSSSQQVGDMAYAEGLALGAKVVLGKPYFRNIRYDADRGKMLAEVFSGNDTSFTRNVEFTVTLSNAKDFKEKLLTNKIVPAITFDTNLNVLNAKTLSNSAIEDLHYHQAKRNRSTSALQDFITKYPNSVKITEMRSLIAKNKADEAQRIAQKRQAEALAKKRAEEKARQDAYDYEHACEKYYVGYVGEYERGGWLATGEKFVVRYTNPERKSLTIEATEGGNSLSYGENKELSCFDLLQAEKRAKN